MSDETMDEGVEISVTDEVEGDADLMAATTKKPGYVEQDNL